MSSDRIPASVLQLGDPRLRAASVPVLDVHDATFKREVRILTRTLDDFRDSRGFGRAISAPQIGIAKRFFVVNLGEGPFLVANRRLPGAARSCSRCGTTACRSRASSPGVMRHESFSLRYLSETGETREWGAPGARGVGARSARDHHLDGVLAIDRALGEGALVTRTMFEAASARYLAEVDYTIATPARSNRPPPPHGAA